MQPGNGLDKDNVTSFDMRKNIVDHQGPLTTPYQCEINASRRNQAKIASDLLAIGGANSFPLAKGKSLTKWSKTVCNLTSNASLVSSPEINATFNGRVGAG